jgi:hypothetical protein
MLALDTRSRAACLGVALLAFAAAAWHDPLAAQTPPPPEPLPVATTALATPRRVAAVAPRRDPFVGAPVSSAAQPVTDAPAFPRVAPPPIPGAPTAAIGNAAQGERVTAIVTGAHPYALVANGERTRVVTIGDRVAGVPIAAIGVQGVRLADGRSLMIDAVIPTPPSPAPASHV